MNRNFRFKIREHGSEVKITLRPGQSLQHHWHKAHEEGFSYCSTTFTHTGDGVLCETASGGRDCDGRVDHFSSVFCKKENLRAHSFQSCIFGDDTVYTGYPKWEEETHEVYDQYAQMSGY